MRFVELTDYVAEAKTESFMTVVNAIEWEVGNVLGIGPGNRQRSDSRGTQAAGGHIEKVAYYASEQECEAEVQKFGQLLSAPRIPVAFCVAVSSPANIIGK